MSIDLLPIAARLTARGIRLTVVQSLFDSGELTEAEARELLAGPLVPGDDSTTVDDSDLLEVAHERT